MQLLSSHVQWLAAMKRKWRLEDPGKALRIVLTYAAALPPPACSALVTPSVATDKPRSLTPFNVRLRASQASWLQQLATKETDGDVSALVRSILDGLTASLDAATEERVFTVVRCASTCAKTAL